VAAKLKVALEFIPFELGVLAVAERQQLVLGTYGDLLQSTCMDTLGVEGEGWKREKGHKQKQHTHTQLVNCHSCRTAWLLLTRMP
jgi:hypothetical protein